MSQGCEDAPLLTVAKKEILTYVHEVTEEEPVPAPESADAADELMGNSSEQNDFSEEECGFMDDECEEDEAQQDSDEESEFDE